MPNPLTDPLIPHDVKLAACLTVVLPTMGDDPRVTAARGHLADGRPDDALAAIVDLLLCPDCNGRLDRRSMVAACAYRHAGHRSHDEGDGTR